MAFGAAERYLNLERSVQHFVRQKMEVEDSTLSGAISYDDVDFNTSGKDTWVVVHLLDVGVTVTADVRLQFTIAQRREKRDPWGAKMKQTADFIRQKMNVNDIPFYDFGEGVEGQSPSPVYLQGESLVIAVRHEGPDGRFPDTIEGLRSMFLTYGLHIWRDEIVQ